MPRGFTAQDGKGMDEIREYVNKNGWELFRDKGKACSYIFIDSEENAFATKFKDKIGKLYDEVTTKGIEKFIKEYKFESSTKADMIRDKRIKISIAKLRARKKVNSAQIEELTAKRYDIGVKLLSLSLKRKSPEHFKLREELHNVVDELKRLGGYEGFSMHSISKEDMELARKKGEAVKKERKERKEKTLKKAKVNI